jgi:L-asparagine transporter-like permease
MADWKEWLFRLGVLVAIALAATVIALLFQTYYGHRELFAALGQVLAIFGAVIFALWLLRRSNGRR